MLKYIVLLMPSCTAALLCAYLVGVKTQETVSQLEIVELRSVEW
jgi:hypothetical protein